MILVLAHLCFIQRLGGSVSSGRTLLWILVTIFTAAQVFFRASLAPTPVSRSVNCSVSQKHFQILASICERDICPFHKWVAPELQETILGKWLNIDILALGNQKLILIFKSLKSLSGVGESEIQWWLFLLQQDFLQGVNVWPWITMETMDDKETMDEKTKIVMNHLENTHWQETFDKCGHFYFWTQNVDVSDI